MVIGGFFKGLFGGDGAKPTTNAAAQHYAAVSKSSATGQLANSRRRVAVMAPTAELQIYLAQHLRPVVVRAKWEYDESPTPDVAIGAQVVLLDVTPHADARLHDKYDKILRLKKALGKLNVDTFCVMGHRRDYRRYPRGTYPGLWYFCIPPEGDPEQREADLPGDGLETVEGPRLFNFADVVPAIQSRIENKM